MSRRFFGTAARWLGKEALNMVNDMCDGRLFVFDLHVLRKVPHSTD